MRPAVAGLVAALVVAPAAARADPMPIPQSDTDTPFVGAPATPDPIVSPDPPRHPHMAPNGSSNLHVDAYQTDANQGPGPLGVRPEVRSTFYANDCASITFDARGRLVTVCVGLLGPTLRMLDPRTLDELASFSLPPRGPPNPAHPSPFNDFGGGGYFYLDDHDQAVVATTTGHLYVIGETDPAGFALRRDYDLTSVVGSGDKIFSALPDWAGHIWFVTTRGVVGYVDPGTGAVRARPTGEEVANSFAVDELGGVYLVTDRALYRFDAGPVGPIVTWRQQYPNSGVAKPGQVDAGSGTTPTITPRGLVAITDNADPMNVLLYDRRTGAEVCRTPVFAKGASATDNSLVSFGDALIVENNYGYSGPLATEQGSSTTPGIWRVDYDPATGRCGVTWRSDEISPTVVPKVSLANGLLYVWTKPAGDPNDPWYLTAIDARTGTTVFKQLAGTGLGFNNNYAPITLGADGTVFQGVLGGMVAIRDAVPPPGAAPVGSREPSAGCRRLPGPEAHARGAALRLAPAGLSSITVQRVLVRRGSVRSRRVLAVAPTRRARTWRGRALSDGTYVVSFRSGRERRRLVFVRRHGRFRAGAPIDLVASCVRAALAGPLFGRHGLLVTADTGAPGAPLTVVARRAGEHGVRRVRKASPLRARLRLAPGTWRLTVEVRGRAVGSLTSRRPA